MKAMILAAGLGTRLRPLTDDRPKALVELAGRTLLEITLGRLRAAGVTHFIVNTHHFPELIDDFFRTHPYPGLRIEISHEPILLDTGGGLKNAAWFFDDRQPFILHNVDILSTIDIAAMLRFHTERGALATLAVQHRPTSRYLLFDESGHLCGRRAGLTGTPELVRPTPNPQAQAFAGIHILSPEIFSLLTETGAFSIIEAYLRLAAEGHTIAAFPTADAYWRDLGRPDQIAQAASDIAAGLYPSQ
jgi:NDP-sugar pyrophosphorylase family protein